MEICNFKNLFQRVSKVFMANFKNVVLEVSEGLESASLRSVERFESVMLINGYRHSKETHADKNSSQSYTKDSYSRRIP